MIGLIFLSFPRRLGKTGLRSDRVHVSLSNGKVVVSGAVTQTERALVAQRRMFPAVTPDAQEVRTGQVSTDITSMLSRR